MHNPWRGEVQAVLGGRQYTLRLTLGALAELETALGGEDIIAFAKRLSQGRIRANDVMHVLTAALHGGGHQIDDQDIAHLMPSGGFSEAMEIVAQLITLSFGGGGGEAAPLGKPGTKAASPGSESSL